MQERLAVIERDPGQRQILEGLPISSDVNLDYVTKLAPANADLDSLQQRVAERFQHLVDLKKQLGVPEPTEVDFGLAIALVDDEVYEKVIEETHAQGEDKEVADHEIGHSIVAGSFGWKTKSMTIEPGSSYRGLTEAVPQSNLSFEDFALRFAAICFGGAHAAAMMGHKVRGEGSDIAKARALARAVVQNPYSRYSSEEAFLRDAETLAHIALSRHGISGINKQSLVLFERKTIT